MPASSPQTVVVVAATTKAQTMVAITMVASTTETKVETSVKDLQVDMLAATFSTRREASTA